MIIVIAGLIPPKPRLLYLFVSDTTPLICLCFTVLAAHGLDPRVRDGAEGREDLRRRLVTK